MLPNKGINKISELKTSFTHSWVEPDFIKSSLKSFTFSSLCKALGPFKLRGYSFESIFTMLLSLPFLGIETVNSMYNHYLIEQTYDRSKEVDNGKIETAINMFRKAISQGFMIDYALMDSWFTCEAFIDAVKRVKNQTVHLIGMYSTPKTLFNYCTRQLTHSQIRNTLGKPKRCRKLHLYYQEASVEYKGYFLKLFYSKQGANGKWHVILTTDTDISFIKMIEIYQIRWSIEVFFKESKQLLNLGRCHSNNFDAHIADITMTLIQYILISMRYRFDTYETKWGIFKHISEQTIQYRLSERLWGLFIELLTVIEKLFEGIDEMELIEKIMRDNEAFEIMCRILPIKAQSQTAA